MDDEKYNSSEIKLVILNSKEPLLIKDTIKWKILDWSLEDWRRNIGDEKMTFRSGLNRRTVEPQWERRTKSFDETFDYFLKRSHGDRLEWLYFDYKYLNSTFIKVGELREEIHWATLGFPEIKADDCSIWIGSKGAHTPCHFDSYGCNLVFQIYGRKLWMLYPPEENLKPTRIPYEESSVYSKLNFFSPNIENFKGLSDKCRKVVLNPGDVLLVPNKWWHYVENLETSISINVWLPLPQDDEERLKEAIVQFFVKQMSSSSDAMLNNLILNPNMEEVILQNDMASTFLDMIHSCKIACLKKELTIKKLKVETKQKENADMVNISEILQKYSSIINLLPLLPQEEFFSTMKKQNDRFENRVCDEKLTLRSSDENATELFNVLTDMEVIELIKNKLLERT